MTKIIFLDIDGVLNRFMHPVAGTKKIFFEDCPDPRLRNAAYLEETQVRNFKAWYAAAAAEFGPMSIVVSSSWRDFFEPFEEGPLFSFLAEALALPVQCFAGATPRGYFEERSSQIEEAMVRHAWRLEDVLILDDQSRIFEGDRPLFTRIVFTDGLHGFTPEDGDKASMLLRGRLREERPASKKLKLWLIQRVGLMAAFGYMSPSDILTVAEALGIRAARALFLLKTIKKTIPQLQVMLESMAKGGPS